MSDASVIKEFLVSLGFKLDDAGLSKFTGGIAGATAQAVKLGLEIEVAAKAVTAAVAVIASGLENVYFASIRTKSSVENIQSFGFAMGQLGSTAEGARGSLENLARFMRNSPGASGLINSLGVGTKEANGELRDTTEIMADLGVKFREMPYYRANAYAQTLGIDEKTLMAMREGLGEFGEQYKAMLHAAGVDSQQAAKASHEFMNELRLLGASLQILSVKVGSTLAGGIGDSIKKFRELLVANFDKISVVIGKIVSVVLTLADVISTLVLRAVQVIEWLIQQWDNLDETTKDFLKTVGLLVAAWYALNAAFTASPIGIILSLAAAILLLWDDYQVWQKGGKSLINWGDWEPAITAAVKGITAVRDAIKSAYEWIEKLSTKYLSGTKVGNAIGAGLAHVFAFLGNKDAQEAIDVNNGKKPAAVTGGKKVNSLADLIGRGEGDYNSVNLGAAGNYKASTRDLSSMTVQQVMDAQANKEFNAAGKYQLITPTMSAAVKSMGLKGDEKFDAAMQDRIFNEYLIGTKRKEIGDFISGKSKDANAAVLAMSKEWASVANPATGESYYAGTGNNKASITAKEATDALMNMRAAQIGNPYSAEMLPAANNTQTSASIAPVINQTTNVTVNGATNPAATAAAVGSEQNNVNTRLVRNLKGAVS